MTTTGRFPVFFLTKLQSHNTARNKNGTEKAAIYNCVVTPREYG